MCMTLPHFLSAWLSGFDPTCSPSAFICFLINLPAFCLRPWDSVFCLLVSDPACPQLCRPSGKPDHLPLLTPSFSQCLWGFLTTSITIKFLCCVSQSCVYLTSCATCGSLYRMCHKVVVFLHLFAIFSQMFLSALFLGYLCTLWYVLFWMLWC